MIEELHRCCRFSNKTGGAGEKNPEVRRGDFGEKVNQVRMHIIDVFAG